MLDFLLVLGQIPGTHFQITFYEYIVSVIVLACAVFRYQLRLLLTTQKMSLMIYLKQKYWQRKQLSLPV
jgi:hypothetical protein